jgi:hypothetical protein
MKESQVPPCIALNDYSLLVWSSSPWQACQQKVTATVETKATIIMTRACDLKSGWYFPSQCLSEEQAFIDAPQRKGLQKKIITP